MHGLADFDRLLSGHAAASRHWLRSPSTTRSQSRLLRDPQGHVVAGWQGQPSLADILAAAHRLQPGDWCGVLADEGSRPAPNPAWRLALFRAERHGQPRLGRDTGPLWISPALKARAGERPAELLQSLRRAAVQALWAQGWRLSA
ncbi:MAG TPA: hypothetical protein VK195_10740 [Burkholderiaceae bacterium]|nr:hypothetical protein [Burkholderiaceae bacterium]